MSNDSSINISSNSPYAHQNYARIDTPSTAQDHANTLIAASRTVEILRAHLDPQVKWAVRGYLSYACYMYNQKLYQRYTDVSYIH